MYYRINHPEYHSFIPQEAQEQVKQTDKNGLRQTEYFLDQELVGLRYFHENGHLATECSYRQGKKYGAFYTFHPNGQLQEVEYYDEEGLPHGIMKQWNSQGELLGTYTMNHGTGMDVWRTQMEDNSIEMSEIRFLEKGLLQGFEWMFSGNPSLLFWERHFYQGMEHGIERMWSDGSLDPDYPKYYIHGEKVDQEAYLLAATKDSTLPPYREEENVPIRNFPKEVQELLLS